MLTDIDVQAMMQAAMKRLQISFTYMKATTGETKSYQGGVVEMRASEGVAFIWDTGQNDHIRKFLFSNFMSLQVLPTAFNNAGAGGYPLIINGQIMDEPTAPATLQPTAVQQPLVPQPEDAVQPQTQPPVQQ